MDTFYVGITDLEWLSLFRKDYDTGKTEKYINFWTSGTRKFKALRPGDVFLFKLHNKKTDNENGKIVGGGYFLYYEQISVLEAWEKYGRGNGRESLEKLQESLHSIQKKDATSPDDRIGCIILENIFFFDNEIDEPSDWKQGTVSGKKYSTDTEIGANLYNAVQNEISKCPKLNENEIDKIEAELDDAPLKGEERLSIVKIRINQSTFREKLLKKYHACCLCGMENSALLIASHIKPWADSSPEEKLDIENGFLLCPNHDALFDGGYISFADDGKIIISRKLSAKDCVLTNINPSMNIVLSDKNKKYLAYHRTKVFLE